MSRCPSEAEVLPSRFEPVPTRWARVLLRCRKPESPPLRMCLFGCISSIFVRCALGVEPPPAPDVLPSRRFWEKWIYFYCSRGSFQTRWKMNIYIYIILYRESDDVTYFCFRAQIFSFRITSRVFALISFCSRRRAF